MLMPFATAASDDAFFFAAAAALLPRQLLRCRVADTIAAARCFSARVYADMPPMPPRCYAAHVCRRCRRHMLICFFRYFSSCMMLAAPYLRALICCRHVSRYAGAYVTYAMQWRRRRRFERCR